MGCRHERLECTNNVLRCAICGAVLPLAMLKPHPSTAAPLPPSPKGKATTPSVSAEGAATFPEREGFKSGEAAENPRKIGFESHKEAAKPRRSRKTR